MKRTDKRKRFGIFNRYFTLSLLACAIYAMSCGGQTNPGTKSNAAIDPANIDSVSGPLSACPSGGRLNFGAVSLVIPSGALAQCVQISLHFGDSVDVAPNTLFANNESYSPHPLVFEPHGLKFSAPIVVLITANRRLDPGTLIPILYKDYASSPWQGLYLAQGTLPAIGVVLSDGLTVAYTTDHFSQYIQFEPGLTTELLSLCGPFQTINGSVPFTCPQFLFGNGWPAALGLNDAGARSRAYRFAISDLVLAPEIHYSVEVYNNVQNVLSQAFTVLGYADITSKIFADQIFHGLSLVFPGWGQFYGNHGAFVPVEARIQSDVEGIFKVVDRVNLARMVLNQVGQTAFAIWALNTMDYAAAVSRMELLKSILSQSPLWKDPALQAALGQVALDIQNDFDARGQGVLKLFTRALVNRGDSLDWVSNYPELAGITTSAIGLVVKLSAEADVLAFAANVIIDWASTLAEATRGEEYLSAMGTLFIYGGLNQDYARKGLRVALPAGITSQAESDRWNRNFMAETALFRLSQQASKAVNLSDVTLTQWVLQRLGEALDNNLLGLGLDRTAIANRINTEGDQHLTQADAIRAVLLQAQPLPPALKP